MSHTNPTRRDFIRATAAGAAGFALAETATGSLRPPLRLGTAKSCIFINMVGGPAHLDTFDPKPDAPSDVRGPFRPIQTATPGLHVSELFPKLAKLSDTFSLIRSMHHDAPPVHECGFQLLNTGRLFRDGPDWPSVGAVMSYLNESPQHRYLYHVIPTLEVATGVNVSRGFGNAHLGREPSVWRGGGPDAMEGTKFARFGHSGFGKNCAWAALTSRCHTKYGGGSFITVNQFSTVFDSPSWDCHADGGSLRTNLNDIRDTVAPSFDTAFAALLTDLETRGLLDSTLVVATGEFGRTPKLNSNGGRDHWAGCWTALVAGGGVKGGRVIGRSDRTGSEPADRPVSPQELVSSIFHALGVPPDATIPGPDGAPVAVYPGAPVAELI